MKQNNMLAMILAGGRGSRLHDLTNKVAKPAVSYGGKYRIVDFPLSNCANSGIDVVGVLTRPVKKPMRIWMFIAEPQMLFRRISILSTIMIRNIFSFFPVTIFTR